MVDSDQQSAGGDRGRRRPQHRPSSHLEVSEAPGRARACSAIGGDIDAQRQPRGRRPPVRRARPSKYVGVGASTGLLVQRSVLQAGATAKPATLARSNAQRRRSTPRRSSAGTAGSSSKTKAPATQTLTLSASTIDAGAPGIVADAVGTTGVEALAKGAPAERCQRRDRGLDRARAAGGARRRRATRRASTCSLLGGAEPDAGGGRRRGIDRVRQRHRAATPKPNPLASLFSEPLSGYQLSPSSSAVDSVPAGAICAARSG